MSDSVKPRRISEFLPEVLQTDLINKFFAATADHMFQPERVEYVNAYVGSLPDQYDANTDARISEQSKLRIDYQLQQAAVSRNTTNTQITHALLYDDLIQKLRWQGALVEDHNRLFSAEYYSFGVPVDWDKLINYSQYVWLPDGVRTIQLLSETDQTQIQNQSSYVYNGEYTLQDDPVSRTGAITFTSGLRVQFARDVNPDVRNNIYIVEGVGKLIRLVQDFLEPNLAWDSPDAWDQAVWGESSVSDQATYVCMGRGSVNQNPWSMQNRWFHKQVAALSETTLTNEVKQTAQRPILEFAWDCTLWNFGKQFRSAVNLVDDVRTSLTDVQDQPDVHVDGVRLDDGQVVLFTNLRDPTNINEFDPVLNNRLFRVSNVRAENKVSLSVLPNQADTSGAALPGDVIWVLQGSTQNVNTYRHYDQMRWKLSQSRQILPEWDPESVIYKQTINQSPLFELYDHTGVNLADPAVYPDSDFAGSTLLQYKINPAQPVDPVLGYRVDVDDQSARNYVFTVTGAVASVSYNVVNQRQAIPGYYYWQQNNTYLNNWFLSAQPSRQYVVNEYVALEGDTQFEIDQTPAANVGGPPSLTVRVGSTDLQPNQYTVVSNKVILTKAASDGDVVRIRTWAGLRNQVVDGYFEIPTNLKCNPNNLIVPEFSMAQVFTHAYSVLKNQTGFVGSVSGSNNYRDTAQDQGVGTHMLQHRAPMLKLMILNAVNQTDVFEGSQSVTDPMYCIQWAQSEYLRFYNKFVNSLFSLYNNQAITASTPPLEWIQKALKQVNLGKTRSSAWVNSGFDMQAGAYCTSESVNPTWVPASAARLGATPVYEPEVFLDLTQPVDPVTLTHPLSLRCHNGAILVLKDYENQNLGTISNDLTHTTFVNQLTHPVAQAWLLFEQLVYASLPEKYAQTEHVPDLDPRTIWSGKFRQTNYSRADWISIASVSWQKWLTLNQIDALKNTSFDVTNAFTWNYGACVDADQQSVPGHYRGIYFYYYDTDKPDQAPWEMLGYSQQPGWWDSEYGAAPYTSGNQKMWQDLADGRIRQGLRQGVHAAWARPGLLNHIPVNEAGELLAPFDAGIVTDQPTLTQAAADWKFGDRAPLENVWLTTADSDFLWAQWAYLAQPACFVEYLWDNNRQIKVFADQPYSQWVYTDTFSRKSSSEFLMHRENPSLLLTVPASDETYYGSCGIQHWISEKLVSESRSVTQYLGNRIRGTDVNLTHRMGGFTDGANLRVLVDSFGLGNSDNLLLPQEDVQCELLRSASTGEYVYTGVIVEYRGRSTGWRVIGYDAVNPFFLIIPSDQRGGKQTVVVDNQTVIEYKQGLKTTQQIPYGTIFETRQQVFDFLISLGRAQAAQGWIFDQYDSTVSRPRDWSLSAREYLFWSQGPWAAGTYITLSPLATMVKFQTEFGTIQNVGDQVNGAYSVLDRVGQVIRLNDLDFLRLDDQISVKPFNDQGIYALRLYTTSLEHVLIFNNLTVFGDVVYNPVFDQAQHRFKLFGYRTLNWQGRLNAPGYLVTQSVDDSTGIVKIRNQIIPNLEKSVDDIRKLFEIDLATTFRSPSGANQQVSTISQTVPSNLSRLAQHMTGYQPRPYLTDLLLDNSAEFQFYLGMIKQKGTSSVIDALLRNNQVVKPEEQFSYFEEWAFRSGTYGYEQDLNYLDIKLIQSEVTGNPQLIQLLSDRSEDIKNDDQIVIVPADDRIVNSSGDQNNFKLRDHYGPALGDLPTAGYVQPEEVDYQVGTDSDLRNLFSDLLALSQIEPIVQVLQNGDIIWQFVDSARGWNVWKVYRTLWNISRTSPNRTDPAYTTVYTDTSHGLKPGDLIIIYGVVNAGVNISNTFEVINVWDDVSFDIQITTTGDGVGGTTLGFWSMRFSSTVDRLMKTPPMGWQRRDITYVDGTSQTPYEVSIWTGRVWIQLRTENLKTDPRFIQGSRLYDLTNLQTLSYLTYWDPVKNRIPGVLDNEITYKTPYDPAQYTQDESGIYGTNAPDAWGSDQVGVTWWDISTTRFRDYELGSDSYRRQYWGAIAPGTTIDVYEWVRSPVPPASWANLVSAGTDLSAIGSPGPASGQVRNLNAPHVIRAQQNSSGQLQAVYYFWVRDTVQVPQVPFRNLSTQQISQGLTNPENLGISWYGVISDQSVLVGNVGRLLNGENTVLQMTWLRKQDVETSHAEYDLVRPLDPRSAPPAWLWNKLHDSLVEFNTQNDSVPNLRLKDLQRTGVLEQPVQSVFKNTQVARRIVVNLVNQFMANNPVPPRSDTERNSWQSYFFSSEAEPESVNQINPVQVATLSYDLADETSGRLNAYYVNNQLIAAEMGALIVDGEQLQNGDRLLVKNQQDETHATNAVQSTVSLAAQNGVYVVVQSGDALNPWRIQRVNELNQSGSVWTQAQVQVISGSQALSVWHQTNDYVLTLGESDIVWQSGPAQPTYSQKVNNMSELYALSYSLPTDTRVFVAPDAVNRMKWTIWSWTRTQGNQFEWLLVRSQSYRTTSMWSYVDWYAPGYNAQQIPSQTYETLQDRDQDLAVTTNTLVKVVNTGDGAWAWFVKANLPDQTWLLVAEQMGGIQLSDALWDYEKYFMGFGVGGFGSEIAGAEYDSRLEFDQIWQGLWRPLSGGGLLKVTSTQNEPNQLLFALVRRVFEEQTFVDWAFKTSFINLRGFAQELLPSNQYTTNKINSLLAYVNESKPYHAKIRQFVDWRTAQDTYSMNNVDFDKPPYADANLGVRILNPDVTSDQVILSTNERYTAWYNNFVLSPQLVRSIKTRLIFDRVSCEPVITYSPGYTAATIPDQIVSTLNGWLSLIEDTSIPQGELVQVQIVDWYVMIRNTQFTGTLSDWDVQLWGLNYTGVINQVIYDSMTLFASLNQSVPRGHALKVKVDDWQTLNWFVRLNTNTQSLQDWLLVAESLPMGAADRIQQQYGEVPTSLISGCESKLMTLDGNPFVKEDSWDQTGWDDVFGWDHSDQGGQVYDINVQSAQSPRYQVFVGDNSQTKFVLRGAPQEPQALMVYVNGVRAYSPQDWNIRNQVSQAIISAPGLGYLINDQIELGGGEYTSTAKFKVTQVTLTGGILSMIQQSPGTWSVVPDNPIMVMGGSGLNASMYVRWQGDTIEFSVAPSVPMRNAPNVWVLEKGASFLPVLQNMLENTFDGAGLNRPHLEAGHPEELGMVWPRQNILLDVYTTGTGGNLPLREHVYESDGIRAHFGLNAQITQDAQIWVWVNGILQVWGPLNDYVINYETQTVVFVVPPAPGLVTLITVGMGAPSLGVGTTQIVNAGINYQIGDIITLNTGLPSTNRARVQVTAVGAQQIQIVQGGQNYRVGDLLYYKRGTGNQTLQVQVTQVGNQNGVRGAIQAVQIVQAGNYTNVSTLADNWFTTGTGTQAQLLPVWGVTQVYVLQRGVYLQAPTQGTQLSVQNAQGDPSPGTGCVLQVAASYVKQQVSLVGDGVTNSVILQEPPFNNSVLITLNGKIVTDYFTDSIDTRRIIFAFTPQLGDMLFVNVYSSQLRSMKMNEQLVILPATLTYTLVNPPLYQPAQHLMSQVYKNGRLLKAPHVSLAQGDGVQVTFDLNATPSAFSDITVWANNSLLPSYLYAPGPAPDQITFLTAPDSHTQLVMQVLISSAPNYDYVIQGDQITFEPTSVVAGDQINVVTFTEDSSVNWSQDQFVGVTPAQYALTQAPVQLDNLQVFVDGVLQQAVWDYEIVNLAGDIYVRFAPVVTHSSINQITCRYQTQPHAQPPVAFRMFENVYGDLKWFRLSDQRATRLSQDLLWNDTFAWVLDGRALSAATSSQPGAVWINAERMEYHTLELDPTSEYPFRHKLGDLRRGTWGTSQGVQSMLSVSYQNGDGESVRWLAPYGLDTRVKVNDTEQVPDVNFEFEINPEGVVPGTYVKFFQAPSVGSQNIQFVRIIQSAQQGEISHVAQTVVRDATANSEIPAGYRWPYGDQGIQMSMEPQTAFLLAEPGVRIT